MGVPNAHDETALPLAEPVGHDGDDAGPARGLEHAARHLEPELDKTRVFKKKQPSGFFCFFVFWGFLGFFVYFFVFFIYLPRRESF